MPFGVLMNKTEEQAEGRCLGYDDDVPLRCPQAVGHTVLKVRTDRGLDKKYRLANPQQRVGR